MVHNKLRVNIKSEQDIEEIKEQLRTVEIVGYPSARPYQDSPIELEELPLSDIQPMALYIVRNALARQAALRTALLKLNYDTLHLSSGLQIQCDDTSVGLLPPIVEETDEGLCLMDGLHRAMLARSIGERTIRAIHITEVDPAYPLSSYPNSWEEVKMYDQTPEDRTLKKHYRPDGYYFRDLSKLNGSRHRKGGDEA